MRFTKEIFLLTLLPIIATFLAVSTAFAGAEPPLPEVVSKIEITGNQRIESATILSFLEIKEEDSVAPSDIDKSIGKLFNSGLFADVSIKFAGGILNIIVIENPIISEIAFEGNNKFETSTLLTEVRLAPRAVYTKTAIQRDVKRIQDLYRRSGRFSATVTPKVIQLEQNRINLIFEIDEGKKSGIAQISFVGNERFSSEKLRETIQTKVSRWYKFFSSDDTYDPDRLAFDNELLRRYYVSKGYADFQVLSATAELIPNREDFIVTFTLDEGRPYVFGEMSVESRLPDLEGGRLNNLLKTPNNDIFNARLVEDSVEAITKELGNLGYAFVRIEPQYNRDVEAGIIGINYLIKEGPRVYIENIDISGNVRTMDKVIRREFRFAEGDPYNAKKIKRSKQRIANLGFFKNVEIKKISGSTKDKANIDVKVTEQSTGELQFGAGFSTSDGALGNVSISERNLLGKGQFLKLNFTMAAVRQEVDLSFTEPYFMDKNISAGFDLFKFTRDGNSSRTNLSFDNDAQGGVLRISYPISEHLRHSLRYSYRSDDITDVDAMASTFIRQQEGKNTTSLIGHSIILDKRDNKFKPREGYYLRLNQDIAGLGGDSKFFRNEIRGGYYRPVLRDDWILKLTGRTGYIFGIGSENVRINDRFFIGSNDIRGFDSEGIGPRDETTKDPLGGNFYMTSSAEMAFPLGTPEEMGFSGSVFSDIGTLFKVDDKSTAASHILDEASLRASIGVGVSWVSPVGPIRIDLAHPFVKEDFDETEVVRFSFGTRF